MSRGGKRAGAGRKGLTLTQKLLIGGFCARRWEEIAEQEAMRRHQTWSQTKEISLEQSRTDLIPIGQRRQAKQLLQDIAEDIDDITGGARRVSIPVTRPYGAKDEMVSDIIAELDNTYGLKVSTSQVIESWKEWSKFQNSPEYKDFLNST
jgi:hypothetical protein